MTQRDRIEKGPVTSLYLSSLSDEQLIDLLQLKTTQLLTAARFKITDQEFVNQLKEEVKLIQTEHYQRKLRSVN
jgi:hypothetical protein